MRIPPYYLLEIIGTVITLLKNNIQTCKNVAAQNVVNISTHTEQGCLVLKKVNEGIHNIILVQKASKTTTLFPKMLGLCFLKIFTSLRSRRILFLSIHQCHTSNLPVLSQTALPHQKDSPLRRLCLRLHQPFQLPAALQLSRSELDLGSRNILPCRNRGTE